jgi:hypothetical protein
MERVLAVAVLQNPDDPASRGDKAKQARERP